MMKPAKLKLRDIFLVLAIANANFWVKGHPMPAETATLIAADAKNGAATIHGDGAGVINLGGAHDVSPTNSHDTINPSSAIKDLKNEQGPRMDLKSTSKTEKTGALEAEEVSKPWEKVHVKPFGARMEFLEPHQVRALPDDDVIRYMAEKDEGVKDMAIKLRNAAQKVKEDPKYKDEYAKAYKATTAAARKLASDESLTREALKKLTDEEYAAKAALFDKDVYQKNLVWINDGALEHLTVGNFYWKLYGNLIRSVGKDKIAKELERLSLDPKNHKEFIKGIVQHHPENKELKYYSARIQVLKESAEKAKKGALRGADAVFKRNKILKSKDSEVLKYKSTGFQAYIDKILAWLSKLIPTKSYIKSLAKP